MLLAIQLISGAGRGIILYCVHVVPENIHTPKKVIGNCVVEGEFKRSDLQRIV